MQRFIRESLEPCLVLAAHPRAVISVTVQVLEDDGSVCAAACSATCAAAMDAGLPMTATFVATAMSVSREGRILLDCTAQEEQVRSAQAPRSPHGRRRTLSPPRARRTPARC